MRTYRKAGAGVPRHPLSEAPLLQVVLAKQDGAVKIVSKLEGAEMANHLGSKKSDQSESMIEADTANGEAPVTIQDDATASRRGDKRTVEHPIDTLQAQKILQDDPPA